MPDKNPIDWITPGEAAKLFGVSPKTLGRWTKKNAHGEARLPRLWPPEAPPEHQMEVWMVTLGEKPRHRYNRFALKAVQAYRSAQAEQSRQRL